MTKESKKEQSIELLNLLQEVKYEIETNTKSKITRNVCKENKNICKDTWYLQNAKVFVCFQK